MPPCTKGQTRHYHDKNVTKVLVAVETDNHTIVKRAEPWFLSTAVAKVSTAPRAELAPAESLL